MYDQETLSKIFDENVEGVYRFFYFKTLSKEDAEDLTSDTFLTFVSQVSNQKSIENPQSYLYGIAKNCFLKYLRRKYLFSSLRLDENLLTEEAIDEVSEVINKNGIESLLTRLIPQLPPKQKLVITMRLVQKMSLQEISAQLGKDMNYVKTTQKRAIKNLKKLILCTPPGT